MSTILPPSIPISLMNPKNRLQVHLFKDEHNTRCDQAYKLVPAVAVATTLSIVQALTADAESWVSERWRRKGGVVRPQCH